MTEEIIKVNGGSKEVLETLIELLDETNLEEDRYLKIYSCFEDLYGYFSNKKEDGKINHENPGLIASLMFTLVRYFERQHDYDKIIRGGM